MERRRPYFDSRAQRLAAAAMAALWLAMAFHGVFRKSPTIDEVPHIGDALAILEFGDYRINPEHPPLFKVLSVLPGWLLAGPTIDIEGNQSLRNIWAVEYANLWGYWLIYMLDAPHERLVALSRIVPVLTGLLGAWLAFLLGREFGGARAGLLAAALLMFYPEYLGHSRFVTLDVPNLVACSAVVLAGWRCRRRATPGRIAAFVAVCAIGSLIKLPVTMTVFVVWAAMGGLSLADTLRRRSSSAPSSGAMSLRRFAATTLLLIAAGTFAQWAGAGFREDLESDLQPREMPSRFLVDETWQSGALRVLKPLRSLHVLPEATFAVLGHTGHSQGRGVILLGEKNYEGWYHYFAVTTALKTPFLHLALLLPALWFAGRSLLRGRGIERERIVFFVLPFIVLLAVTVLSRLNIGHRHVMFIYVPWAVLAAAQVARWTARRGNAGRFLVPGIAVVAAATCAGVHPHQETYFNPIAGEDRMRRLEFLADSNVDWGEDLILACETAIDMGFLRANVAYFGAGRPEAYGLEEIRQILPNYPFAIRLDEDKLPDPRLPTLVSLNTLHSVLAMYPGLLDGEPPVVCNSILVFPPNPAWRPREALLPNL